MSEFDFSNITKRHAVNAETTAEYSFDFIEGEPTLLLAPMLDSNEAYLNESLRISVEAAEARQNEQPTRGKPAKPGKEERVKMTASQLEKDREQDRVLIARTCAKGWGSRPPAMKDGSSPEFSEAAVYAFLKALPNYMFDPLRGWVSNPFNFTPKAPLPPGVAEEVGNGSPSS